MKDWINKDAVIFDVEADQIISELLDAGYDVNDAIKWVEETQHIIIKI